MNLNYTSICHYCGKIYRSNRSTSKYCSKQHNSLYAANGSNIDFTILNSQDMYISYHDVLSALYHRIAIYRTWTKGCSHFEVVGRFRYKGPLPKADELLLVSGFLIRKQYCPHRLRDYYYFKPMGILTKNEKAMYRIINPSFYYLKDDY